MILPVRVFIGRADDAPSESERYRYLTMTIPKAVAIVVQCDLRLRKKHTVPADAIVRCAGARAQ